MLRLAVLLLFTFSLSIKAGSIPVPHQLWVKVWQEHWDALKIKPVDDYTQWKQALGTTKSADPSRFFVQQGFQIELLRSAKQDEGSWVSLEFDPKGRLIIAREDKGLLRLTINDKDIRVETINDTLKECRGLLYAHDSLYANANESSGLYRLRDTNGDDQFDEVKLLLQTGGGKGHGRNDLALGPDRKIYAIHGDAVEMPDIAKSLCSPLRKFSHKGRSGFVLRTDPEGKQWEIVTMGLRNPYGIDFNSDGEMFTYDADAEYDMGSSWYRPTRVHHLLPGGDYRWRAVTRSWPAYDPDKPDAAPPSLDIGKGSPTAVKFGTNSRFPPRYRRALFVLDWAYGRILAIHMTPRGATYAMRPETFLKGRPFNVTDLGFGPDGAMYIVTGGRKTQSGLYRVTYVGKKVTESTSTNNAREMREVRHRLERFASKRTEADRQLILTHLNNPDDALRHAARIALEHLPVKQWRQQALTETRPRAALTLLLSLAQHRAKDNHSSIMERLAKFPLRTLSVEQQLIALRVYDLILSQSPLKSITEQCLNRLNPCYPSSHFEVNKQLSLLLEQLQAPKFVERTLALLRSTTVQREQFHFIYVLRNVRKGWTAERHQEYFRWISHMRGFLGGEGMPTFIKRIESEALARLSENERAKIAPLLADKAHTIIIPEEAKNRKFVRNWTLNDLEGSLSMVSQGRNFKRGQKMFRAASCVACHRMQQAGGAIGPDLTSLAARFSRRDMLASILQPDKVVAEQYRRDVLETSDGKVVTGMIIEGNDYRSPQLRLLTDPLRPDTIITIEKKNIESHRKSMTSQMPQGLLNTLTREEILDLLSYLESGGKK